MVTISEKGVLMKLQVRLFVGEVEVPAEKWNKVVIKNDNVMRYMNAASTRDEKEQKSA